MPLSVSGGTPPYKLTVLREMVGPKIVQYATGRFEYALDMKSGTNFSMAIEDSTGKGAVSPLMVVGDSANAACLGVAQTVAADSPALATVYPGSTLPPSAFPDAGSSKNDIIAIVVGSVVGGSVTIVVVLWLLYKYSQLVPFCHSIAYDDRSDGGESRSVDSERGGNGGADPDARGTRATNSTVSNMAEVGVGAAAPPPNSAFSNIPTPPRAGDRQPNYFVEPGTNEHRRWRRAATHNGFGSPSSPPERENYFATSRPPRR
ncbi:hypothetical protein FRB99_006372 [Tulasnella sp. 403]|nr:hypothetical protein FRB99_006372 [Tulasnella sp. 403]